MRAFVVECRAAPLLRRRGRVPSAREGPISGLRYCAVPGLAMFERIKAKIAADIYERVQPGQERDELLLLLKHVISNAVHDRAIQCGRAFNTVRNIHRCSTRH